MIRIFLFTSFFCFIAGRNTGGQDYGADVTKGDYVTRPEETTPPVFVDKWHENGTWEHYERCSVNSDCRKPGQKCHNLADASCICKSGKCKITGGDYGAYVTKRPSEETTRIMIDQWHPNGTWEHYERCSVNSDCRKPGQKCHNLAGDASCICKSGKCKMINGFCGTYNGHGFLTPCSTCDKDSCKAAGDMCRWVWKSVAGAKCEATSKGMKLEKEARKKGKLTTEGQDYAGKGSCSVDSDCRKPGQECHNLADASCICKSGKCKKITGSCGSYDGHGRHTPCSTCDKDSCMASSTCQWVWTSPAKCVARSVPAEETAEETTILYSDHWDKDGKWTHQSSGGGQDYATYTCGPESCKAGSKLCHWSGGKCVPTGKDNAGKGSCSVDSDCRKPGQKCHNIMDAGCECKSGKCEMTGGDWRGPDSCSVDSDCKKSGKMCHNMIIADASCLCKSGKCEITGGDFNII